MHEDLDHPDRRAPVGEILLLIKQVHDNQVSLSEKLNQHMNEETQELAQAITELMKDAFPGGDPSGHRRRHELELEELKEKAEFWKKMRLALAQWGLLGFAGWLVYTVWNALLLGPHK